MPSAEEPIPSTFPRVLIGYDARRMSSHAAASTVERVGQQWRWLSPEQPWAVAAAAALTGLLIVVSGQIEASGDERALDALAYAMVVVCGAALLGLRRHPVAAVAVITIALSVWLGRGYAGGPIFVTLWIGLFALGRLAPRRTAWIAATAALGALVLVSVVADTSPGLVEHALLVVWSAVAVLAGDAVRSHAERVAARDDRDRQHAQTREEETRRRLAEERLRIARDLHDTVAHTMATINVQAGAAAHVMERRPEQARDALLVIQQASGEALDELAALLQLLRVDPGVEPGKAPTPGLADLEELLASTRRAGLEVTLHVDGTFDDVPPSIGVALYRIVQESLTNVVRHAGTARAIVRLSRDRGGGPSVEIVDNGTAPPNMARGTGVGIRGMRERAETTGGYLDAGPLPDGGFRVVATWPLTSVVRGPADTPERPS